MSTMSQRSHLTDSEAWRIVGRLEGGHTNAEVAQAIGVSQSVIFRIWKRFLEAGSAGRRPGQGRRRATTPNEDRYLVLTARRHRNMNATLLQQHLRSATGTTVSTQTVRNRLHGVGLYARRPMVCVRLTSRHRRDCRERIFIWSDRGSGNKPAFVHESVRFGGGGALVYGGISIDGCTDLYIIRDGPLTARRYRDEILRPIVVLYAAEIGDYFILMDGNCRPHRANLVEDFLFEEGIVRMEWPACFPDMNPIEPVWDALGRRVAGRQLPPQTLKELERALLEEWDRISQLVINSFIDSMPQSGSGLELVTRQATIRYLYHSATTATIALKERGFGYVLTVTSAQRLSKEFKNYVSCARAMQAASKSLMDTLTEMYEQNWIGSEQLPVKTQVLEMVWDDFCHKLNDQVGVPVATYLSQFPEIRGKIAKRGRKLVDYDKCRHNLQSLQQPNRKREEMKIGKAKERLDEARKLYEVINNELHDELPALYDSRISFLVTNLQTMFTSESQFHHENAKLYNQLTEVVENLALENQKGKYRTRKPGSPLILKSDGDTRPYEEIEFKKSRVSNGEILSSNTLPRTEHKMREINLTVSQTNAMNADSSNMDQLRRPLKTEKDYEPVEVSIFDFF
ncbi:amphiphysin [Trichonephila clavipes]|nr:amphiphysin [Trichonephila clavipes]